VPVLHFAIWSGALVIACKRVLVSRMWRWQSGLLLLVGLNQIANLWAGWPWWIWIVTLNVIIWTAIHAVGASPMEVFGPPPPSPFEQQRISLALKTISVVTMLPLIVTACFIALTVLAVILDTLGILPLCPTCKCH
jgi:hypothetical protein